MEIKIGPFTSDDIIAERNMSMHEQAKHISNVMHYNIDPFVQPNEYQAVDPLKVLPFTTPILPVNGQKLSEIFPGYIEPTKEQIAEQVEYASKAENYGTAPGEAAALLQSLVKAIKPETAFVFGTARGRLEHLIAYACSSTIIATIDLPTDLLGLTRGTPDTNNIRYRTKIGIDSDDKIGDIFKNDQQICRQIFPILGDAFEFNAEALKGKIRLSVIDCNHALPNVLMDLANAVQMSRPEGALIFVDDFKKASPLNMGVDAACVLFNQLTNIPVLWPCPKPGEDGLTASVALIVIPAGAPVAELSEKLRTVALSLKG